MFLLLTDYFTNVFLMITYDYYQLILDYATIKNIKCHNFNNLVIIMNYYMLKIV